MKRTFFNLAAALLTAAVCAFCADAKKDADDYRIIAIMADGSRIDGYIASSLTNHMRPFVTSVSISREFGGEKEKYNSEQVASVVYPPSEKDTTTVVFHSIRVQSKLSHLWNKNPKPYKKPVFLRLIYNGENIKGYVMPILDQTNGQTMSVSHYTWRYYYLRKGDDVAKAYWDDINGIIPGMKRVMKFFFRDFPELQDMVDAGEIKGGDFRDNPAMVLPLMDHCMASATE